MNNRKKTKVAIVGAGFTGLSIAYELSKKNIPVVVLEAESDIGGLAAAFNVNGEKLDRFYHHWFTNDKDIMGLIEELGLSSQVEINPTNTGVYYANNFFKLSTPWDLLNFKPLKFGDRIKLGILALRARRVKDWKKLENLTAHDWLRSLGGESVYKVVWQPLLKGKFGPFAEDVSAVWFWNKLKLRGGSRGKGGEERLAYFKGGFVALAEALASEIKSRGGEIILNAPVSGIAYDDNQWNLEFNKETLSAQRVVATSPLPITSKLIENWASNEYLQSLNRIKYIGNVCLVLELSKSLSNTYWLNVNDPDFPFVGVIEHTNFEKVETYGGRHIVYLSKYLPTSDHLYSLTKSEFLTYTIPYLKRMFPGFSEDWILNSHLWHAEYSQPIVEKHYGALIPDENGPIEGFHLCTMAQIYPEDRGTNYAVREGRRIGKKIVNYVS